MRYYNPNAAIGLAHVEPHRPISEDRFFNKEDPPVPRATGQQMLRTLVDKIPAQVRETNQIRLRFRVEVLD
jgi:hypothetical protein